MTRITAAFVALAMIAAACGDGGDAIDAQTADDAFTILWAGDTLQADRVMPLLEEHGYDWPFDELRADVADADYMVVNLEGPITSSTTPLDPDQVWSYNAEPEAAEALARLGVDAGSLANNHGMDRGELGVTDSYANLSAAGIEGFGAGTETGALDPLLIETPFGTVGVVGFGEHYGDHRTATATGVGTLAATPATIEQGHARASAAGADWVVAFVHWGRNYEPVDTDQRRTARDFVDAGYDLVVGHGAHLARPIEIVDGVPIVFSLGNFVFGTAGRYTTEAPGHSILLTTHVDGDGLHAATIHCLLTDNDEVRYQPRLCDDETARPVLAGLHPEVALDGGTGLLRW